MTVEELLGQVPEYAKDLKLNLPNVLRQAELTEQQTWGTAVATAIAARHPQLRDTMLCEAAQHLSPEALRAAKAAAAVMGMNNVYYRFLHLCGNDAYRQIPARLRMQMIRMHGGDPVDFELWCLAVSAVNGCGACVQSHEAVLKEKGVREETVIGAVRIASVIHGLASVLGVE